MCGLFQPVGQVRLTNVATVRLKVNNVRFEVACYRNKIVNWKSGVETDIQEVLQSPYVFTSISKGKLAKTEELIKAFKTKDMDVICKQILDKGEIQVSKEERNQLLQEMFKDIVTIITEVTINPKTWRPLTSTLIENTLKASAFSINLKEPAKKQALKALAHLQQLYPNDIARSQMRLKISCLKSQRLAVLEFLKVNGAYVEQDGHSARDNEDTGSNGPSPYRTQAKDVANARVSEDPTTDNGAEEGGVAGEDHVIKGRSSLPYASKKEEAVVSIRFLCCTKIYREIDHYVSNVMQPPGLLQLVSLNVKDAGNRGLVPIVDDTIDTNHDQGNLKSTQDPSKLVAEVSTIEDGIHEMNIKSSTENPATSIAQDSKKKTFKCTNCRMDFTNSADFRSHCKSELHVINNKMVLKGMAPMTQEEFQALDICLKNSSLET